MAVYGRFKERWNPTKAKSKVSKNLTYEIDGEDAKVFFWMNIDSFDEDGSAFTGIKGRAEIFDDNGASFTPKRYAPIDQVLDAYSHEGLPLPTLTPVKAAHFQPNAIHFPKGAIGSDERSYVQSGENEMSFTTLELVGPYLNGNGRVFDTWVTFWVKTYQDNYDESGGHNMGGFYRSVPNSPAEESPTTLHLSPAILFSITSSGAPEMTLIQHNQPNNRINYVGDVDADDLNIEPGEWTQVSWLIKRLQKDGVLYKYSDMVELYINGVQVSVSAADESTPNPQIPDSVSTAWFDALPLEVLFGNQTRGYLAGYNNNQGPGEGFEGALGEFLVFSQPEGTDEERKRMAKFVYEAQREGAFHLHSGIHSSSPRLEQLDLDRDSSLPPNFSMPAYTRVNPEDQYDPEKKDENYWVRFTEGYNTLETWKEEASKYYVPSNNVLPHLRLDPADTILTNGNWYSDARSEFFSEDLDPTTGFVVPDASSDELYREHAYTGQLTPFQDLNVPEEYRDCFVIEIPLHNTSELTLGTEVGDNINGNNLGPEIATFQSNTFEGEFTGVDHFNPNQNINTMAYYNFKLQKWETTTVPWSSYNTSIGQHDWFGAADIGFSPMTGLYFPKDFRELQLMSSLLGKPMSDFGFPFHRKFESAEDGQTIDLSKYLDESVILEGWEVYHPVVPKVGFDEGYNYEGAYKGGDHYGVQGHAASFWDVTNYISPFENRVLEVADPGDAGNRYVVDGTIPVGKWNSSDGGITFTEDDHGPDLDAPGIVTKGVTCFLMKETQNPEAHYQKAKFQSIDRLVTTQGNHIDYGFEGSTSLSSTVVDVGVEGTTFDLNLQDEYGQNNTGWPQAEDDWYDPVGTGTPTESRFETGSTREIIGYLQHVYHNDENIHRPRTKWQRYRDPNHPDDVHGPVTDSTGIHTAPYFGMKPEWDAISMETILGGDNYTYVYDVNPQTGQPEELLRTNTKSYPFHVSGSLRGEIPYSGGPTINIFAITDTTGENTTTNPNDPKYFDRGIWVPEIGTGTSFFTGEQFTYLDTSNTDMYKVTSAIASNEGNTSSNFVNYDSIPNIIGKGPTSAVEFPRTVLPNSGDSVYQATFDLIGEYPPPGAYTRVVQCSPENNADTDTILRPSDKLILGIQDSVSTTLASQQGVADGGDHGWLGWGRNSLKLLENQSGYLRLYVRRTRNDKPYNAVSDESNYNQNVNRDLGDHAIDDDFFINSPKMYSGSMADDIMGPTYFTPPIMKVAVNIPTDLADLELVAGFENDDGGVVDSAFSSRCFRQIVVSPGDNFDDKYNTPIQPLLDGMRELPWYALSAKVFFPRGQTSNRRYPSIEWKDGWVQPYIDNRVAAGSPASSVWSMYNQFFEMFHWVIADFNPDGTFPYLPFNSGSNAYSGVRNRCTAHPDELNTNSDAPPFTGLQITNTNSLVIAVSGENIDMSLMGYENPAMSAWYTRLVIPTFLEFPGQMTPSENAIVVEFRLVKIPSRRQSLSPGSQSANSYFYSTPTYSDGTDMRLGDVWYFNEKHERIKVDQFVGSYDPDYWQNAAESSAFSILSDYKNHPNAEAFLQFFGNDEQDWARNWYPQRGAYNGPVLFIVAAEVKSGSQTWLDIETQSGGYPDVWGNTENYKRALTLQNVYSIISRTIAIQMTMDRTLLGSVENYWDGNATVVDGKLDFGHDGNFSIVLPPDPNVRASFQTFKDDINKLMEFQLLGLDVTNGIGNKLRDELTLFKPGGVPTPLDPDGGGGTPETQGGDLPDGVFLAAQNPPHYIVSDSNFIRRYNRPFENLQSSSTNCTERTFGLDYSNFPTIAPVLEITKETFNEVTGRSIDRFVEKRSSTDVINYVEGGPKLAGPFGSLKKTIHLQSTDVYVDSLVPANLTGVTGYSTTFSHQTREQAEANGDTWNNTDYMTTIYDIPEEFPFELSINRRFDVRPEEVKIKMRTTEGEAGETGIDPSNSSRINYTNDTGDSVGGVLVWGTGTNPDSDATEGDLGLLNVTNYIQADSSQLAQFQKKTPRDLLLGFGDGVKGSHTIRPLMYPDMLAWTGTTPVRFSTQFVMDPPRGSKFGLINTQRTTPSYKFSYRHYGYLRDMLEQGLDSKTTRHRSDEEIFGSPVVVNAINPTNPEISKLMENTDRFNKTVDCTIVKPYIEDNYEGIPNPVNLKSEKLRVDVAGSIKSKQILAPGNVASNIRRR